MGPDLAAQTVHSLAGCGVPNSARDFDKIMARWNVKKWKSIEMLVLDEIGMLNADYLDWLDVYVRKARRRPLEPFGGIQLVFVGDFAQVRLRRGCLFPHQNIDASFSLNMFPLHSSVLSPAEFLWPTRPTVPAKIRPTVS